MEILNILRLVFFVVVLVIFFVFLVFSVGNIFLAAPFVPSSKKTSKRMIDAINLKKTDVVYDLGSGDGRLVILAARKGVKKAVGFEVNLLLNVWGRFKSKLLKLNNTVFITKSFWKADLSVCDKLFVYTSIKSMKRLEKKVLSEMKDGSYVISNTFSFPNLEPVEIIDNVKIYKINKLDNSITK